MTTLSTRNFATLVQGQAAAMQARCSQLIDFSVGAVLRAIVESNAAVSLWLQGLLIKVLATTRLSTSFGADADSWVEDYGVTRLGVQFALGTVTFSRFTPSAQAVVPIGALVRSADGEQLFEVIIDASNTAYNAGLSGYVIPGGVGSLSVPVQATVGGAGGNVQAHTVTLISGIIPFVDTVDNAAPFTGGGDQESDSGLKTRFVAFISSLAKATAAAIQYEAQKLQIGVQFTITESYNPDGSYHPGFFYVGIDDGSGNPPSVLLTRVYDAIDKVRAAGVLFAVIPPTIVTANVAMTLTIATGYEPNVVRAAVGASLMANIKALGLGNKLPYTKLAQWAYEASSGVLNVTGITLNGLSADLAASAVQTIKPGTVTVT